MRAYELMVIIDGALDDGAVDTTVARITEQITALTIGINIRHKATAGIKLTGLPAAGSFGD